MRHEPWRIQLLLYAIPSIMSAIAIYMIMGMKILLLMPLLAVSLAVSYKFEARLAARRRRRSELDELGGVLKAAHDEMSATGRPLSSILLKSTSFGKHRARTAVREHVSRIAKRISMGQDLACAIEQERSSATAIGALKPMAEEYSLNSDIVGSIKGIYAGIERGRELDMERSSGSMHRNLVTSMVASTVLPSISVFGFVGYSIFYYSFLELAGFSVVMLAALPALSSIVNSKIADAIG